MLRWARESCGLSEVAAARKLNLPDDRVAAWESGDATSTIAQLRKAGGLPVTGGALPIRAAWMTTVLNRQLTDTHQLTLADVQLLEILDSSPAGSVQTGDLAEALTSSPASPQWGERCWGKTWSPTPPRSRLTSLRR